MLEALISHMSCVRLILMRKSVGSKVHTELILVSRDFPYLLSHHIFMSTVDRSYLCGFQDMAAIM
jgi:hypothetical protein